MKKLSFSLFGFLLATSCSLQEHTSDVNVTNGKAEDGFPYVARIVMDSGGSCTGSFVSDSLLITASHCVDKTKVVRWEGFSSIPDEIYVHPNWPSQGTGCQNVAQPKYDVALVQFPAGTYKGQPARLLIRTPKAGEELTIVGYGNNRIIPYDKFCKLQLNPIDKNECQIVVGNRVSGAKYDYTPVFSFLAKEEVSAVGCPVRCGSTNMKTSLANEKTTFEDLVVEQCDGNFRDRSYKETGSGVKRSGKNKILNVADGTIQFQGGIGTESDGINSASGAGDSGGPLFITENGQPKIAGVTHGGTLGTGEDEFVKRSTYVDLSASHNMDWLKKIVKEKKLNFPDLK